MELIDILPPQARILQNTLPEPPFKEHCSTYVNGKIVLTGGWNSRKRVLSITAHNGEMNLMSKMNFNHYNHGCASFSKGNKQYIVVTGGNWIGPIGQYPSNVTEILDVENNIWKIGENSNTFNMHYD